MMEDRRNGGNSKVQKEILVSDFELLPKPICQEIFFRISARDLMQCKRVCTSWYKIIREPNFAMNYSKKSPFITFIFRENIIYDEVWYLFEFSEKGDFIWTRFKPTIPDSLKKGGIFFVCSSCNGFLCIYGPKPRPESELEPEPGLGHDIVSINNPVLGESITLPLHEIDKDVYTEAYILGFVPSINRFKVVRIIFGLSQEDKTEKCQIFTIGVDEKWRHVENGFTGYSECEIMPCLHGVLHWIPRVDSACGIYTFDLAEEKIGKILNPPGVVVNWRTMNLKLFGNQLCLFDKSDMTQVTIWTMQNYGITESWTKDVLLGSWFPSGVFRVVLVGKSRNGDMFFMTTDFRDNDRTFFKVKNGKCVEIGALPAKDGPGNLLLYAPNFSSLEEFMVKGNQE